MSDWHAFSLFLLLLTFAFVLYSIWLDFPPRRDK
jgi:hypothetical protein